MARHVTDALGGVASWRCSTSDGCAARAASGAKSPRLLSRVGTGASARLEVEEWHPVGPTAQCLTDKPQNYQYDTGVEHASSKTPFLQKQLLKIPPHGVVSRARRRRSFTAPASWWSCSPSQVALGPLALALAKRTRVFHGRSPSPSYLPPSIRRSFGDGFLR